MPDLKEIIERLQEMASNRGGKMILALILTLGAILAAIRYMLWSGTLDLLEGGWKVAHNFVVLIFFLLLALAIALILWPKSELGQRREMKTDKSSSKRGGISLEHDTLRRWSNLVVLIWIGIMAVMIYAFGWFMIVKDLLIPTIQELSMTPFEWSVKYLTDNVLLPFVMVTMFIIMPFVFYIEIGNQRMKEKQTKDSKTRR